MTDQEFLKRINDYAEIKLADVECSLNIWILQVKPVQNAKHNLSRTFRMLSSKDRVSSKKVFIRHGMNTFLIFTYSDS